MSIRRATPADAANLAAVAGETFALACPPGTTQSNIDAFIGSFLSRSAFERYLAGPSYRLWVAGAHGRVIGYAMTLHGEPADPDIRDAVLERPTVELSKIYVLPTHHGHGVARQLLDAALEEARSSGARSVWLGVNQHNIRANAFYEKNGFHTRGTRHFRVGENLEADFVRERGLSDVDPGLHPATA